MKKVLFLFATTMLAMSCFGQVRESANKIAETVNPNYCTTSDGQPGTLRRSSSTTTTSQSSSSSSSSSSGYSSSSSSSVSASAGFSGIKPEAKVSGSTGTSSSNNQSSSTGSGNSSTTTRQDNYTCFPARR